MNNIDRLVEHTNCYSRSQNQTQSHERPGEGEDSVNRKPNIEKLAEYINRQPDPERFAAALISLAAAKKRT